MPAESPIPIERLFDLYKIAIDEYRFEVKLGWDRAMYYLIFNSAIVSVATGLLKLENPPVVHLFIGAIYLLGFFTSLMGAQGIEKAHEYYRRTIVKKTLIEDMLGLTSPQDGYAGLTLTVGTTSGQGDSLQILHNTEPWVERPLRRYSIMYWIRGLLYGLAAINAAGFVMATVMCFRPPVKPEYGPPARIIPTVTRVTPATGYTDFLLSNAKTLACQT